MFVFACIEISICFHSVMQKERKIHTHIRFVYAVYHRWLRQTWTVFFYFYSFTLFVAVYYNYCCFLRFFSVLFGNRKYFAWKQCIYRICLYLPVPGCVYVHFEHDTQSPSRKKMWKNLQLFGLINFLIAGPEKKEKTHTQILQYTQQRHLFPQFSELKRMTPKKKMTSASEYFISGKKYKKKYTLNDFRYTHTTSHMSIYMAYRKYLFIRHIYEE